MRPNIVLVAMTTLLMAACGGSGGGGDYSAQLANTIRLDAPGRITATSGNLNAAVNVSNVSCVRQGSTESYSCTAHVSLTDYGHTSSAVFSFSGSCDNSGKCEWHNKS